MPITIYIVASYLSVCATTYLQSQYPFTVLPVHYPCTHNSMTVIHVYNNSKVTSKLSNTIYTYKTSSEMEEVNLRYPGHQTLFRHLIASYFCHLNCLAKGSEACPQGKFSILIHLGCHFGLVIKMLGIARMLLSSRYYIVIFAIVKPEPCSYTLTHS